VGVVFFLFRPQIAEGIETELNKKANVCAYKWSDGRIRDARGVNDCRPFSRDLLRNFSKRTSIMQIDIFADGRVAFVVKSRKEHPELMFSLNLPKIRTTRKDDPGKWRSTRQIFTEICNQQCSRQSRLLSLNFSGLCSLKIVSKDGS
jgi:hypothetical protein